MFNMNNAWENERSFDLSKAIAFGAVTRLNPALAFALAFFDAARGASRNVVPPSQPAGCAGCVATRDYDAWLDGEENEDDLVASRDDDGWLDGEDDEDNEEWLDEDEEEDDDWDDDDDEWLDEDDDDDGWVDDEDEDDDDYWQEVDEDDEDEDDWNDQDYDDGEEDDDF